MYSNELWGGGEGGEGGGEGGGGVCVLGGGGVEVKFGTFKRRRGYKNRTTANQGRVGLNFGHFMIT